MKLEYVNVGTIYKCKLSGKQMLISLTQKSIQTPTGKNDKNGNPAYTMSTEDVKAGKYSEIVNGVLTFKHDEVYDGQLEEIKS